MPRDRGHRLRAALWGDIEGLPRVAGGPDAALRAVLAIHFE